MTAIHFVVVIVVVLGLVVAGAWLQRIWRERREHK